MADLLLTTGDEFEDYEIQEYLGFVVGQAVYQSKFIKGIAADIQGSEDQDLDDLNDCDEEVKKNLMKAAKAKKANAIIGVEMRYAQLASGSFAVVMTGTAVKIEDVIEEDTGNSITSGADEIMKYKQLLDQGIITPEEFEAKKKQILAL